MACNQPFDPRAELDQKPVIFSVISTDRSTQFVRVEHSYMPADFDPLSNTSDNSIKNATVTITSPSLTVRLRDTMLVRSDTSRFKFPIRAYVAGSLVPSYGATYNLSVGGEQLETVSATVTVPSNPVIGLDISSLAVLDFPAEHDSLADILFPITLGNGSMGYIGRFYVDYDILVKGEWVGGRLEVPTGFAYSGLRSYAFLDFPTLMHRTFSSRTAGLFLNQFYKHAIADVAYEDIGTRRVIFNRVVFQLLQMEQNLYNYYVVSHSNRDPHSIRLDEPMYSNLNGGVGMIGAYTLDSLVHPLPENFIYNRR